MCLCFQQISYHDKELLKDLEIGKLFLVDVGENTAGARSEEGAPDKIGYLKVQNCHKDQV